jgi:hypothetical protein
MRKYQNAALALDDILANLHEELEEGASADRVREIASEHPQFRTEILAFSAEWFRSDGSDLPDDTLAVTSTVSGHAALLDRFWEMAGRDAENPFAGKLLGDLEAIADRCRIDTAILRQLVRGFIDEATIPGKLVAWLAAALGAAPAQVWTFLSSPTLAAAEGRDYFAPDGKRVPGKVSFADAIRSSGLGASDKTFWLRHLEA